MGRKPFVNKQMVLFLKTPICIAIRQMNLTVGYKVLAPYGSNNQIFALGIQNTGFEFSASRVEVTEIDNLANRRNVNVVTTRTTS